MIQGVIDLFPEPKEKGIAKISNFVFKASENQIYNMRNVRDGGWDFYVSDGHYVRLHVGKELMMTDTPLERKSNRDFVQAANGRVLIAGLGIGMIIKNILDKPNVAEIVVIEKYQDVIDLVSPAFTDPRIRYVCADILDYLLPRTEKFDTIYFDIWPAICTDNLEEIYLLEKKFRRNMNKLNPNRWMGSWMKKYLQKEKRKNKFY